MSLQVGDRVEILVWKGRKEKKAVEGTVTELIGKKMCNVSFERTYDSGETVTLTAYKKRADCRIVNPEPVQEEPYECYCSECGCNLEKPDPDMTDKEFEEWFCDDETGGDDIICEKCHLKERVSEIKELKAEIDELKKENDELKKENRKLRSIFNKIKCALA
jgi:hypothetical protein